MRIARVAVLGFAVLTLSAVRAEAQAKDPIIGTWELNPAKSKYTPGPGPKTETRTYVAAGSEIKATSKGVDGAGKPSSGEWTLGYDDKDRPMSGDTNADMLSLKRVNDTTVSITQKKAGKVVATGTRMISKDGKMMTIMLKGTDAAGKQFENTQVFEKK